VTAVEKCPSVQAILVAKRTGNPVISSPLDIDLDEVDSVELSFYNLHIFNKISSFDY
jgi:hypothetical protein